LDENDELDKKILDLLTNIKHLKEKKKNCKKNPDETPINKPDNGGSDNDDDVDDDEEEENKPKNLGTPTPSIEEEIPEKIPIGYDKEVNGCKIEKNGQHRCGPAFEGRCCASGRYCSMFEYCGSSDKYKDKTYNDYWKYTVEYYNKTH